MSTFGERLATERKRNVMTQAELAAKADVALITVTRLENGSGSGNPRPETVRRLARALDVDPAWLLFGEGVQGKAAA